MRQKPAQAQAAPAEVAALECRSMSSGRRRTTTSMTMFQVCDAKKNHVLLKQQRAPGSLGVHCASMGMQRTMRSTIKMP